MKVLSGEGIKDFALLGIFQIVRGQHNPENPIFTRIFWIVYIGLTIKKDI